MMISHTNLKRPDLDHPRLVSVEHARLVTAHGGIVGSVPSGIGQKTIADWIVSILRLVEAVGVDHVAIGTDMDANYMPVFADYAALAADPGGAAGARPDGGRGRQGHGRQLPAADGRRPEAGPGSREDLMTPLAPRRKPTHLPSTASFTFGETPLSLSLYDVSIPVYLRLAEQPLATSWTRPRPTPPRTASPSPP